MSDWTNIDIERAYWLGVVNGSAHERSGRTYWPSMDRVLAEAERVHADNIDVCAAVRALRHAPAQGIVAATEGGSASSQTEPANSPVGSADAPK